MRVAVERFEAIPVSWASDGLNVAWEMDTRSVLSVEADEFGR